MSISIPNWYTLRTEGITQSLLSNYMACPRKFLTAVNGYTTKPRITMITGTVGHKLLQDAREGKSWEKALKAYEFDTWMTAHDREFVKAIMLAIIPAYLDFWRSQKPSWVKIKPEHLFDVRLDQYRLRGKIDGVYTKSDATIGILETKFKSRISEDELNERLTMDFQSLFYLLAMHLERQTYPTEVIYDVVRYPARKAGDINAKEVYTKLSKEIDKNPAYYFYRWHTPFKPKRIESFRNELMQKLDELDGRSVWYKNEFACYSPYKCPYMRFCITGRPEGLTQKQLFSELEEDND